MYTTYTALGIVSAIELSPDVHILALINIDDAQTEQNSETTNARFCTKKIACKDSQELHLFVDS